VTAADVALTSLTALVLPLAARRGLAAASQSIRMRAPDYAALCAGGACAVYCCFRGETPLAILYLTMSLCAVTDVRRGLIPDLVVVVALVSIGASTYVRGDVDACLIGAAAAFAAMAVIFVAARGAMGAGDVKLAAVLGAALGWETGLIALATAFIAGGLVAVGLLVLRRIRRDQALPFAPFMALGAIVAFVTGLSGASFR
jgi:leader peptidase (prepilin peptidase)/N-methyltransferase